MFDWHDQWNRYDNAAPIAKHSNNKTIILWTMADSYQLLLKIEQKYQRQGPLIIVLLWNQVAVFDKPPLIMNSEKRKKKKKRKAFGRKNWKDVHRKTVFALDDAQNIWLQAGQIKKKQKMTRKVDQWSGFRFKVSPSDTRALSSPPTITIWSVASLRFLGVYACVLVVVYNREQVERQLQGLPNTKRKRRHRLLRANLFGQRLNWYRHNLRIPSRIYPTWKAKGAEEDVVVHYCRLTLIPPSPLLGCKWWEIETIEMNWIQKKIVALFFFIVANRPIGGSQSRPQIAAQSNSFHKIPSWLRTFSFLLLSRWQAPLV